MLRRLMRTVAQPDMHGKVAGLREQEESRARVHGGVSGFAALAMIGVLSVERWSHW